MIAAQGFGLAVQPGFQAVISPGFDAMLPEGACIAPVGPAAEPPTEAALDARPPATPAAASSAPEASTAAVLVPGDAIARVIGKAGAGLKNIREHSGVKLVVQSDNTEDRNAKRRVDVIGSPMGVGAAIGQMLQSVANQQIGTVQTAILVPNKSVGTIIGRGGERLKMVREATGVRILVEREPVTNPITGDAERTIVMQGEPMAIGNAVSLGLGGGRLGVVLHHGSLPMTGGALVGGGMLSALGGSRVGGVGAGMLVGAMGVSPNEVHSMPDDPDAVQIHMVIPGKLTGAIVGKQGAHIQSLASQCGCKLSVTARTTDTNRRVVCVGSFAQAQAAQQLVQNSALMACESAGVDPNSLLSATVIFWIPKELSGAVIGKQGATLGAVREQANVKVVFAKEEVKDLRPCTISGPLQNVIQAETLIFNILLHEQQSKGTSRRTRAGGQEPGDEQRQHGNETTKLLVPARSAGAIIGRQGAGLARLREDYGIKVDMLKQDQAPHWLEDRVVILQGPDPNRQNAAVAILQQTFSPDQVQGMLKLLVTHQEAGAIIGKQGCTLKQIRERSGLSVQVQKDDVMGERLVTSQGPAANLASVLRLLFETIASSPPSDL